MPDEDSKPLRSVDSLVKYSTFFNLKMVKFQGFQIIRNENFAQELAEYKKRSKVSSGEILNEKKYPIKKTGLSYRTINHWGSLGLIVDTRKNPAQWRMFSWLDLFWIQVISELRDFGLSIDKIKKTQQCLFNNKEPMLLEFYLYNSYFSIRDCILLVSAEGIADIGTKEEIDLSSFASFLPSYIHINFSYILFRLFKVPSQK